MKRTDIKVGQEYAVGSTSAYEKPCRAIVRELTCERKTKHTWGGVETKRGVLVEIVEAPYTSPKPGDERIYPSREILRPWEEHIRRCECP